MSESPSSAVADEHARPDDYRDRILAAARPVDLADDEKIELTPDEADAFFETLRNA